MERMQSQMMEYFIAEKNESLFFMGAGILAIVISIYLLATANTYRGMAYPLIAIALIQLAVGGAVYFRTDTQVAALEQKLRDAPAEYQSAEKARMTTVRTNFTLYKAIEILLIATGIVLTFAFRRSDLVYAVAIGLILQSSLMLVFDLFAERRADIYMEQIEHLGR